MTESISFLQYLVFCTYEIIQLLTFWHHMIILGTHGLVLPWHLSLVIIYTAVNHYRTVAEN